MQFQNEKDLLKYSQEEEINLFDRVVQNGKPEPEVEDTDPLLDEEDLEEIGLTVEEADQIEWETPKKGSAGFEEKDITD